nr:MAG TPA: hypothetical protein [Caudoviricetes sp.]
MNKKEIKVKPRLIGHTKLAGKKKLVLSSRSD